MLPRLGLPAVLLVTALTISLGYAAPDGALEQAIREIPPDVFAPADRERLTGMVGAQLRQRLAQANARSSADWRSIQTRAGWEAFSSERMQRLRASLGTPLPPAPLAVRVGDEQTVHQCRIRTLVYESRPGLWVSANLYLPARDVARGMPGLILCHSHHRPKEHSELQDMGMTWARAGCAVLVPDLLGHGERRQHPFATAQDFAGEFRPSRQDYYFRYDTGVHLHLAGESLMGWIVNDLRRGVDLLLTLPGIAQDRIVLLGSVAGGGDPVAVAAALDERVACAVAFNFGGPQPETRFPLPEDIETTFNYAGSGSWESTRNLRLSASGGFLPWVIVGAIAPRRLVYAHEFSWHRERDPVWKRLQSIHGFCETPDRLAFTHGRGELRGNAPEATHCTHIGRPHREGIHAAFNRWWGIGAQEFSKPLPEQSLRYWNADLVRTLAPKRLVELLPVLVSPPRGRVPLDAAGLRAALPPLLGGVEPKPGAAPALQKVVESVGALRVERLALRTEAGIEVPLMLILPKAGTARRPVVLAFSQEGKAGFLHRRAGDLAALLGEGVMVCLADLRGTGETRAGTDRGPEGADAAHCATTTMLGDTVMGARLRDARAVLAWLRARSDVDTRRMALWGDSLAEPNAPGAPTLTPRRVANMPRQSDPGAALLAMLTALFEPEVRALHTHGGLADFTAVLKHPMLLVPHDAIVPGLLRVCDTPDLAKALAPRPLRQTGVVNALNQRQQADEAATSAGAWLARQLAAP